MPFMVDIFNLKVTTDIIFHHEGHEVNEAIKQNFSSLALIDKH